MVKSKENTNKTKKIMEELKYLAIIVGFLAAGILPFWGMIWYSTQYRELTYDLCDLNGETYGIYYRVSSSAPAHNYDVITLCINGSAHTFEGTVTISFSDSTKPYAVVKDYNILRADEIFVCVPPGSINYMQNVGLR